jgi:hypothetical protein
MKTKTSLLIVGIALAALMATASSASAAVISTDKPDYEPGETVAISGTGFLGGVNTVTISITRPDGVVDSGSIDIGFADGGAFLYSYVLDGIQGTYHVTASDGYYTAHTTFTDADPSDIPEFSTIALPVASILGLLFFFNRRKRSKE